MYIHIIGTRTHPTPKGPGQFHLNERVEESRLEAIWTNPSESFVERSGGLSSTGSETNSAVVRGASIPAPLWGPYGDCRSSHRFASGKGWGWFAISPEQRCRAAMSQAKFSSCFPSSVLTVQARRSLGILRLRLGVQMSSLLEDFFRKSCRPFAKSITVNGPPAESMA